MLKKYSMQSMQSSTNQSLTDDAEVSKHSAGKFIKILFAGLQSQDKGQMTEATTKLYFKAVDGLPEWAVKEATELLVTGRIGNGQFVPMPGAFAKHVLSLIEAKQKLELEAARRKRDDDKLKEEFALCQRRKDFQNGKTPESRARVAAMLEETKRNLQQQED